MAYLIIDNKSCERFRDLLVDDTYNTSKSRQTLVQGTRPQC